jgi:site-specific recombinase XerD
VELLVGTGLRVGELLALKIGDLVIGDRSGKVIVRMGKHDRYREIPLTATLRQVLNAYLKEHPESKNLDAMLWIGQRGTLNDRSAVLRILEKYMLAAQLPAIGPHVLRHTFATRYLRANPGDLRGLAALLGHTSLDTVMIYTEPSADDLAERMERAETAILENQG